MAGPVSRKRRLEEIANLVGNAVAHLVLYKNEYGIREALIYRGQAAAIAEASTWNEEEVKRFKQLALRRGKLRNAQVKGAGGDSRRRLKRLRDSLKNL